MNLRVLTCVVAVVVFSYSLEDTLTHLEQILV